MHGARVSPSHCINTKTYDHSSHERTISTSSPIVRHTMISILGIWIEGGVERARFPLSSRKVSIYIEKYEVLPLPVGQWPVKQGGCPSSEAQTPLRLRLELVQTGFIRKMLLEELSDDGSTISGLKLIPSENVRLPIPRQSASALTTDGYGMERNFVVFRMHIRSIPLHSYSNHIRYQ